MVSAVTSVLRHRVSLCLIRYNRKPDVLKAADVYDSGGHGIAAFRLDVTRLD